MTKSKPRVVSLLPSTTEIVAALGCTNQLVGRSHECDVPAGIGSLPACTQPKFNPQGQSYQIDQRVQALLQEGLSVYRVDGECLARLQPDIIITQDHCKVCAASVDEVKEATRRYLERDVTIISVSPTTLDQVYESIQQIAGALDEPLAGQNLIRSMRQNFIRITDQTSSFETKKILGIEWLSPLMTAGNWVPELAQVANLQSCGAEPGAHSPWIEAKTIRQLDPELICIMPCGYKINQTLSEIKTLTEQEFWPHLSAVKNHHVYIADGHHYFNRPGPRLTDSARVLAEMAYPALAPYFKEKGWINMFE